MTFLQSSINTTEEKKSSKTDIATKPVEEVKKKQNRVLEKWLGIREEFWDHIKESNRNKRILVQENSKEFEGIPVQEMPKALTEEVLKALKNRVVPTRVFLFKRKKKELLFVLPDVLKEEVGETITCAKDTTDGKNLPSINDNTKRLDSDEGMPASERRADEHPVHSEQQSNSIETSSEDSIKVESFHRKLQKLSCAEIFERLEMIGETLEDHETVREDFREKEEEYKDQLRVECYDSECMTDIYDLQDVYQHLLKRFVTHVLLHSF